MLKKILENRLEMNLTNEEEEQFQSATVCHICEKPRSAEKPKFVRDHCHLTGKFRGASHTECNLLYGLSNVKKHKIPVLFHNLAGFDANLIMSAVKPKKHGKLQVLPRTNQRFISFSIGSAEFKDSYSFLGKSLDQLMSTMSEEDLFYTRRFVEHGVLDVEPTSHLPKKEEETFKKNGASNRKRKLSRKQRQEKTFKKKRCAVAHQFVADEAEVSDDSENGDEYDSDLDSNYFDDLINDDDSFDNNDLSIYHQHMYSDTDEEKDGEEQKDGEDNIKEEGEEDHEKRYKSRQELPSDDYRHQKYSSPQLTAAQKEIVDKRMKLLTRKGIFPYEAISSFNKLNDRQLPTQLEFFSSLTGKHITNEDYAHANAVWNEFCDGKTLNDYMDLYLCSDILLLADIFIKFRKMCLQVHKLDPLHSYTLPGFSWQAALKYTGVELELLTDPEMHLFFENAIRGGISVAIKRQAEANIPHMEGYNKDLPTRHIIDLDANNLYGHAMSQLLPTRDFKWASKEYCEATT